MKYEIKIDERQSEPKVTITTSSVTEEVAELIKILDSKQEYLIGYQNRVIKMLDFKLIISLYSFDKKVYAVSSDGEYEIKQRLYDLEELLSGYHFVRISNSEIINLKKVKKFDLSFSGTISVRLANDKLTYVSRRNVKKIKEVLGIGGSRDE